MNNRILKLTENLKPDAAYYISDEKCVRYYSGFSGEGSLLVTAEKSVLFTDFRYTEAAERLDGIEVYDVAGGMEKGFPTFVKNVLLCESQITLSLFKKLQALLPEVEFISDDGAIANTRMVKDEEELNLIRRASDIAENAYEEMLNMVKVGVTEKQLAFEFEWLCRRAGAEAMSFDMVAASGPNSSMPHALVTDRALQSGDFITFDFGCVYNGYCSDMTRTVALGKCSDEQREIYQIVLEAQMAGLAQVHAGVLCKDADAAARNVIKKAGYGKCFGHSLGHGVGLKVHEAPNLSSKSELVLKENMVVTVEPGIYIPGKFGVRIEDLVVVGKQNCEILTKNCKDLLII